MCVLSGPLARLVPVESGVQHRIHPGGNQEGDRTAQPAPRWEKMAFSQAKQSRVWKKMAPRWFSSGERLSVWCRAMRLICFVLGKLHTVCVKLYLFLFFSGAAVLCLSWFLSNEHSGNLALTKGGRKGKACLAKSLQWIHFNATRAQSFALFKPWYVFDCTKIF